MVPANYCVFLYNQGERKSAAKQYNIFEQRMQKMAKEPGSTVDSEVRMVQIGIKSCFRVVYNNVCVCL